MRLINGVNITKEDVLKALASIDEKGIKRGRHSTKYTLYYNGKKYPPKYVVAVAYEAITGKELAPSDHHGGLPTNSLLEEYGFEIRKGASR